MSEQAKQQLWQERLEAWRVSGESMRSFAARHGWAPRQLAWWKKRLAEEATTPLTLLPVKMKATAVTGQIRLTGPSWSLDLPSTTPATWLAELLRSL